MTGKLLAIYLIGSVVFGVIAFGVMEGMDAIGLMPQNQYIQGAIGLLAGAISIICAGLLAMRWDD